MLFCYVLYGFYVCVCRGGGGVGLLVFFWGFYFQITFVGPLSDLLFLRPKQHPTTGLSKTVVSGVLSYDINRKTQRIVLRLADTWR